MLLIMLGIGLMCILLLQYVTKSGNWVIYQYYTILNICFNEITFYVLFYCNLCKPIQYHACNKLHYGQTTSSDKQHMTKEKTSQLYIFQRSVQANRNINLW